MTRDQIYNADDTGLFWWAIPTKSLTNPSEMNDGYKIEKDRVTLMIYANASGMHKLELVFIHGYQKP